jgi:competence protein CoiA
MLVANRFDNSRCIAFETEKSEAPFHCPSCEDEVILKKGKLREHHFAHKPPFDCQYGIGESQIHYKIKRELYSALSVHPNCKKCELERILKGVRPDVSLYIGKYPVAIEIQKTRININYIIRRTIRYADLGIYLLWILTDNMPHTFWHEGEKENVYRIKKWESYLHTMYFNRLYYWQKGAHVIPYHFKPFSTWVAESEFYDEYGDYREEGGFYRETKTLKSPIVFPGPIPHLAEDFDAKLRHESKFEDNTIPHCKLWIDKNQKWWNDLL